MTATADTEKQHRLEVEIVGRLLADDDPPEITKHLGCGLLLANELRDRLPINQLEE